jgi:phage shock protein A
MVGRLQRLIRGLLGQWLGRREGENPGAVYEAAIAERLQQYGKLREAAAGVLYMRGKLTRELETKSGELARLGAQLALAVDAGDDAVALALIGRRDGLAGDVERVRGELAELTEEAETGKKNLIAFQAEIARLRDEKIRMLARLANARARLRLQETLAGLSPDADIRALEAVREHINRLVEETRVSRDLADAGLEERLGKIREAEAAAAARAQLEELKRARRRIQLPMIVPERVFASAGARAAR